MSCDNDEYKSENRRQWWVLAGIAVAVAVLYGGALVLLTLRPADAPVLLPDPAFTDDGGNKYFGGRVQDDEAAEQFRSTFPIKYFGDTPAGKAKMAAKDSTVVFSEAAKQVLGHKLPARNQGSVGSCVSFGTASAIEYLMLIQIVRGDAIQYRDLCQEVIYAGSRVEIGGGRIRGDGSVGAWAAQFVQKYGVITRDRHGSYDLTNYSESLCRSWGLKGVPDDLEPLAKESPVNGITSVRNAEEAKKAIIQGYPIAVCSGQGFSETRDKDGFARASGSWQHCMAVIGYTDVPRRGFLILNSWGANWIRGPKGQFDIPDGSFWCEWSTFDRMCRENDTWAFSEAVGFPAKDPLDDWFIKAMPRRRDVAAAFDVRRPEFAVAW